MQIFRASRLERLALRLHARLYQRRPEPVLQAQTIVVGHAGMRRWLLAWLAAHPLPGLPAVAANLNVLLPGEWIEALAAAHAARAHPGYRREALRWRIDAWLRRSAPAALAAFLDGEDARKRFALADHVASLFTQYLIYRADMLRAWERGATPAQHAWQADLWRALRRELGRGARHDLLADLATQGAVEPLDVFGLSHLPADLLALLVAYAERNDTALYFCDPCRELWALLPSQRTVLDNELSGADYWHTGHPLLAAWGRLGQHMALALADLGAAVDDRDRDDDRSSSGDSLLDRVQHSVRTLQAMPMRSEVGDASLRVHACPSRLRELEVLHATLLAALAADPDLNPADIVVMAPAMAQYAPLIRALFGAPSFAPGALPYHIADAPLDAPPLLRALRALLDLPESRFARSEVLDLLALAPCRRRLGGIDVESLDHWLERANVRFALDGAMRAELGAGDIDDNSFAFGLARMFAGWAFGAEALLVDGVLPAQPVEGPRAADLGALCEALASLSRWRDEVRSPRSLGAWRSAIAAQLAALTECDPFDPHEAQAQRQIDGCLQQLERQSRDARFDDAVPFGAVRTALIGALDGLQSDPPWFNGGVRFCGLVPQRAVPYRLIAILGLNEGEFPRARSGALDLIQSAPRIGDRLPTLDDRYLMLEALMSARRQLHFSYLSIDPGSGGLRNPAAPLADLMACLPADRHWLIDHPLQADARYGRDPRYPLIRQPPTPPNIAPYVFGVAATLDEAVTTLALPDLAGAYRKPARAYLRSLGVDLRILEQHDDDADDDPLDGPSSADLSSIDEWLDVALADGGSVGEPPLAWRDGRLPPAAEGLRWLERTREEANRALATLREEPLLRAPLERLPLDVDLRFGRYRVIGRLRHLYRSGDRQLFLLRSRAEAHFGHWLPVYVEWAIHAELGSRLPLIVYERQQGQLRRHPLCELIGVSRRARHRALWTLLAHASMPNSLAAHFAPRASYAFAVHGLSSAESVFERECKYDASLARVAAPDLLQPGTPAHSRFTLLARRFYALLQGHAP